MGDQATYQIEEELKTVPYVDILLPYLDTFLNELSKIITSKELQIKLRKRLLEEMSKTAEVVLQEELDGFIKHGQSCYQAFVETTNNSLACKYPVLHKILKIIVKNYTQHLQRIFLRFSKDFNLIKKTFSIQLDVNVIIKDIDSTLGDGHSGESTALVTLSDGTKLIYKPRNIEATKSYNLFIDWVNQKLNKNLKTNNCVSRKNYGWLEFVPYEAVNSPNELQEYYQNAGILLAVTLLLGSKDCHYENVIASGHSPVIIDHETIIQPVLSKQSIRTWDEQHNAPPFSVLESLLIVNPESGVPLEFSGFGVKGKTEAMNLEKEVINPNTIDCKRATRFIFRKLVKENIPAYNDAYEFANNYKASFIEGFSVAYDMFTTRQEELLSSNSPLRFFENQEIRYVWRPTFIYFKILKYLRRASFMSSFETYKSKLYDLISKAYQKQNAVKYKSILEHEMNQLLKGDVPLFTLNSLDCHFKEDKSFRVFELNGVGNIKKRIGLLSTAHKEEQIEYITNWLQINVLF